MENKVNNKYFQLGNIIRCIAKGSLTTSKQGIAQSFGEVNYIIYKNSKGTLPISKIFDNLIHYHNRMYTYGNKEIVFKFLNYLKTKFTEEELNLHPDYTAKDGHKHLNQQDDEMFIRGMLSSSKIYDFMDEMEGELKNDKEECYQVRKYMTLWIEGRGVKNDK